MSRLYQCINISILLHWYGNRGGCSGGGGGGPEWKMVNKSNA